MTKQVCIFTMANKITDFDGVRRQEIVSKRLMRAQFATTLYTLGALQHMPTITYLESRDIPKSVAYIRRYFDTTSSAKVNYM